MGRRFNARPSASFGARESDSFFEDLSVPAAAHRRSAPVSIPADPALFGAHPAALFDAVVAGEDTPSEAGGRLVVVARSGDPILGRLQADDILITRAVAEGRLAFASTLVDGVTRPLEACGCGGHRAAEQGPGLYAWVKERWPRSRSVDERFSRKLATPSGLLGEHQVVLRRRELVLETMEDVPVESHEVLADDGAEDWRDDDPEVVTEDLPEVVPEVVPEGFSIPSEAAGSDRVRISLRNDDGTPAAGVAYRVRFRDGHIVNGTLDARGEATIPDRTHGDVRVTFPGLPATSWKIGSFGGS